jgi:hemerythrin
MTQLIEWSDRFAVTVEEINQQHRKLFALVNHFILVALAGDDRKAVENAIDGMVTYVDEHFRFEEACLKFHPELPEHRKLHWDFAKKTMEMAKKVQGQSSQGDDAAKEL